MSCPITARLDALHAKATPGEWLARMWMENHSSGLVNDKYGNPITVVHERRGETEGVANQESIVALHNAWPAISAVLKAAESMADRHRAGYKDSLDPFGELLPAVDALRAMEAG